LEKTLSPIWHEYVSPSASTVARYTERLCPPVHDGVVQTGVAQACGAMRAARANPDRANLFIKTMSVSLVVNGHAASAGRTAALEILTG
jgi:hypothetical protein